MFRVIYDRHENVWLAAPIDGPGAIVTQLDSFTPETSQALSGVEQQNVQLQSRRFNTLAEAHSFADKLNRQKTKAWFDYLNG